MATTATDRYLTLDTIRGVAVMGILLMNIVNFGLIEAAYMNPRAQGGATGLDLAAWLVNFVLFDGKMRGLFSFLFGASTLLVIDRATAKGENPAKVHYSRMIWLLAFGLAHLWLVWRGDILAHYAMVGMIAFAFRNRPTSGLVAIGIVLLVVQLVMMAGLATSVAMIAAGPLPGQSAADHAKSLTEFTNGFGVPAPAQVARDMAAYSGSYPEIVRARFAETAWWPITFLPIYGFETLAYMLFGMAGLRSGMLTGVWERRRYVKWLAIGFGIGIPGYAALAAWTVARDFSLVAVVTAAMAAATIIRPAMIIGWASLIVLLMRPGGALTTRISAAGRMAFTNYLLTSLICTTIFYGYGLGLYGRLPRAELYLIVLAVWAGMLLWSKPWLKHFAYGPFEWLWRSLSRLSFQPMRGGALTS
ncbi:DUF418 domain-containing protein [Sphingomonas floccifaciens]|uniref:DUF418 domain-containing protein n=1 Tax=Sphingomonas floccifaciens TaxID=1844115 RepID=A0ABW4N9Z7_9SPHN